MLLAGAVSATGAGAGETPPRQSNEAARDWLPETATSLDAPERLQEPSDRARLRIALATGGATATTRRIWWSGRRIDAALSLDLEGRSPDAEGGIVARAGALSIGIGALSLGEFGLVGETAGIVRRTRSIGAAGIAGDGSPTRTTGRAAVGASADFDGVLVGVGGRARLALGARRRGEGQASAIEGRFGAVDLRGVAVRSNGRIASAGSVRLRSARPTDRASLEAGLGEAGLFARFGLDARRGSLAAGARGQFESGRERPGGLDLEGSWVTRSAAARLRWRSWSSPARPLSATSTPEDDGRLELDLRAGRGGAGAWTMRAGTKPRQADGSGGERFVVGDLVVARERGRKLRLTAGRREAQRERGWIAGSSVGAAIDLDVIEPSPAGSRERAALTLDVEAVRAERGGGSYGPGLEVADGGSLRTRSRSGLRSAARAWVRLGGWRLGAAADDEDEGTGVDETTGRKARAPRVTLWLAWSGGTAAR
jgi:hypothetical protein